MSGQTLTVRYHGISLNPSRFPPPPRPPRLLFADRACLSRDHPYMRANTNDERQARRRSPDDGTPVLKAGKGRGGWMKKLWRRIRRKGR